ncbi:polysaccharide deacetylase family protein [Yinghuangia seranimata]|uniref:polysaccharide deacetylase family protein n=1 Tax=Yinghuangia seranimata TaxID=408067 RepID=UPI00248BE76A|nr:polysaccharide deacetylase family protein [Yinghuangia seranimata]
MRSASFQAAVAALAVFLCGFLVWTASANPVTGSAQAAETRTGQQDDAGQPSHDEAPFDGKQGTQSPEQPGAVVPAAGTTGAPGTTPPGQVPAILQSKAGRTDPGKWVALTFDDGPWNTYTTQILEVLKQYDIKATFCIVGNQAKALPSLVKAVVAEGHTLCNHTMTHDEQLAKKSPDQIRAEMQHALDAITAAAPGAPVPWYRAPGGNWSPEVKQIAASLGMRSLGWTVDTLDWKKPGIDKILETVDKQLGPGGVILMHDGGGDRAMTIDLLHKLIPKLQAEGYQFTVPVGAAG